MNADSLLSEHNFDKPRSKRFRTLHEAKFTKLFPNSVFN